MNEGLPNKEPLPPVTRPYLWGSLMTGEIVEGETYPFIVFSGGEGLVRLTEQHDIDRAQEEANAAQIGLALREGIEIDINKMEPADPVELPPLIIEEIERSEESWTLAHIESVIKDKDPKGRAVYKLRIREADREDLTGGVESGFMPGSVIEGWCFVDGVDNYFHFNVINGEPTDGIDPTIDRYTEVDPGWYKM